MLPERKQDVVTNAHAYSYSMNILAQLRFNDEIRESISTSKLFFRCLCFVRYPWVHIIARKRSSTKIRLPISVKFMVKIEIFRFHRRPAQ